MPTSVLRRIDRLRPYRVFDRPIFIVAAPRSGSTFLFDLVFQFPQMWAWQEEMDQVWWQLFPFHRSTDPSDQVTSDEFSPATARLIRRDFYRHSLWAREERGANCTLAERVGSARIRYLDKTIANCFHIGFLGQVFPDALYIFLIRDARETISSMIEGWHEPVRFVHRHAQAYIESEKNGVRHWCYPAPPGWRAVLERPLAEICAWSWSRHVESADDALLQIPNEQKLLVRYEELMSDLHGLARRVSQFCGLEWTEEVESFIAKKPLSRTTISAPEPGKWRRLHGKEIEAIVPQVAPLMHRFGYETTA